MEQKRLTKKQKIFLEIYEKNACNITVASKKAQVGRRTYYAWRAQSARFKQACEDVESSLVDFAENKVIELIKQGNTKMIEIFLKAKGRERGYVDKAEVEHSGQVINRIIKVNPTPKEE